MRLTRFIPVAAAIIGIFATATTLQAQGLSVKAAGVKTVKLSDRVGKNQFEWHSTAPLEEIKGTADGVTGALTIDPKFPKSLTGIISVPVSTMKSGNDMRDEHIRNEGWLDAANHPTISFTISSVKDLKVNGNKMTGHAVGNFTMHGVTKQMTIPFTLQYIDASDKTRERAPGDLVMVTADFNVPLADFNVTGSKGVVGSKVGEKISIKAKLFGSTASL